MPLSLVALARVPDHDTGVASSLLNTGQQVGGSIGLAVLGTVAWSAVAGNFRAHPGAGHLSAAQLADHALAAGFSRGYLVSAGIMVPGLIIAVIAIRVRREDLVRGSC